MAKPIIGKITPFDAVNDFTLKFDYIGNQPYKNVATIYRTSDMEVVYTHEQVTMRLENLIAASEAKLENGKQYAVEVTTYDVDGVASPTSDRVFFYCYTTPTFYFENVNSGDTVKNASLAASLYYDQIQFDELYQFQFFIYDTSKTLLSSSDIKYDYGDSSYTYKGLDNVTSYYIRATGVSEAGVEVDTGYIEIYVQYEVPTSYSRIYAEHTGGDGIVDYHTNIIVIEATRDDYEYDNSFINLTNDVIIYNNQFTVPDNFLMAIKHRFEGVGMLMTMTDTDQNLTMTLSIVDCTEGIYRYKLVVPNAFCNYVVYSSPFNADVSTIMTCWVRRVNDLYQIFIYDELSTNTDYNLWLGNSSRPVSNLTNYDVWIDTNGTTSRIVKDDVVLWFQDDEPTAENNNIWIGKGDIE